MDRDEIFNKLSEIIANLMEISREDIEEKSILSDDLGIKSFDFVDCLMIAESDFGIEIPDDEAETIHTVSDFITVIKSHL